MTGQEPVRQFFEELLGTSAVAAGQLMLASQKALRGALEDGPGAAVKLIEKLADVDLIRWFVDQLREAEATVVTTQVPRDQASNHAVVEAGKDGVITGFSYEQSVRPFTMLEKKNKKGLPAPMNTVLTAAAKKGATTPTTARSATSA